MKRVVIGFALVLGLVGVVPNANWGCSVGTRYAPAKACSDKKIMASNWSAKHPVLAYGGVFYPMPSDFAHGKVRLV